MDLKISQLPAAGALTGPEQFPVVQAGVTKVATLQQVVTALQSGLLPDVPEWQPLTVYAANVLVLNPSGQIVSAIATHTSGASFNPANWTVVSLTVAGVQALIAAQAATDSATYVTFRNNDGTKGATMSGRELDTDGTDTFHRLHPWEQASHPLYVPPAERTRENWPPEPTFPAGPAEAKRWAGLPERAPEPANWWNRIWGVH